MEVVLELYTRCCLVGPNQCVCVYVDIDVCVYVCVCVCV